MGSKEGREPQTDETSAAKSLYRSIFLITTFGIAFYQSNLSTSRGIEVFDLVIEAKPETEQKAGTRG
jgi:hypothetical protein